MILEGCVHQQVSTTPLALERGTFFTCEDTWRWLSPWAGDSNLCGMRASVMLILLVFGFKALIASLALEGEEQCVVVLPWWLLIHHILHLKDGTYCDQVKLACVKGCGGCIDWYLGE